MIAIRDFVPSDVADVLRIEHEAHPAGHWSAQDYEWLARVADGIVLVAVEEGGGIAGFIAARSMGPEAEMLNLAVDPDLRRQGTGRNLVEALHNRLRAAGAERVYLEVRPSNLAAQHLYHSVGYVECGRRRGYYASNGEDALVLEIRLRASFSSGNDKSRPAGGSASTPAGS